jgi:hypothetical protein
MQAKHALLLLLAIVVLGAECCHAVKSVRKPLKNLKTKAQLSGAGGPSTSSPWPTELADFPPNTPNPAAATNARSTGPSTQKASGGRERHSESLGVKRTSSTKLGAPKKKKRSTAPVSLC